MKNNLIILSLLVLFLSGCASTQVDRFPNLISDTAQVKSVNVIADFVILEDIAGDDLGINMAKYETGQTALQESIGTTLSEKGVTANFLYVDSGIFFEGIDKDQQTPTDDEAESTKKNNKEGPKLLYSEKFKSTGESFPGFTVKAEWATENNLNLLTDMRREAGEYSPTLENGQTDVTPLVFESLPTEFKGDGATHLLIVDSASIDISAGKTIGVGLLTGILTAVASGGTYIASSTAASSTSMTGLLIDLKDNRLVWTGTIAGAGSKRLGTTANLLINSLYKEVENKQKKAAREAKKKAS